MSKVSVSLDITGRLFKTHVNDMPTLFYLFTGHGVFCWSQVGWNITHWRTFRKLRQYFEHDQRGSIYPSSELDFLVETGKSVAETFGKVCLTCILDDYLDLVEKYNRLMERKNIKNE